MKWNPPNPDMRKPPPALEEPFPWEYVNLDDIIVDLKLRPETLEIRVPRYFKVTEKRDTVFELLLGENGHVHVLIYGAHDQGVVCSSVLLCGVTG